MSAISRAKQRLLVIVGTTGAGKSKLAIEVAKALNGEVVNADSMQMYNGLDIATAKVTLEECSGVKHHLLSTLSPHDNYTVKQYRDAALPIIADINARGRLPVIVGGTLYYIQSLLWESTLLDEHGGGSDEDSGDATPAERTGGATTSDTEQEPTLEPEVLYAQLQEVDPVMARKLHPNDVRKVTRSLQVFHSTGRPHSELIREQREAAAAAAAAAAEKEGMSPSAADAAAAAARSGVPVRVARFDARVLWVNCERKVLHSRLDSRVDKMVEQGVIEEVEGLRKDLLTPHEGLAQQGQGQGLLQAIGFKEFEPFFRLKEKGEAAKGEESSPSTAGLERQLEACIENLKASTRQYARRQLTWIRNKLLKSDVPVYLLDSSDVDKWDRNVLPPALEVARELLGTHAKVTSTSGSSVTASEASAAAAAAGTPGKNIAGTGADLDGWQKYECEICGGRVLNGRREYEEHMAGNKHKKRVQAHRRRLARELQGDHNKRRKNEQQT